MCTGLPEHHALAGADSRRQAGQRSHYVRGGSTSTRIITFVQNLIHLTIISL